MSKNLFVKKAAILALLISYDSVEGIKLHHRAFVNGIDNGDTDVHTLTRQNYETADALQMPNVFRAINKDDGLSALTQEERGWRQAQKSAEEMDTSADRKSMRTEECKMQSFNMEDIHRLSVQPAPRVAPPA